ncbi:MAG: xanthine dehydrogenase molybdenum-binding subunit XdhA [Defluviitaleaceae bacterium]|nr:xanthine dehydrogenase molybdenum-binding subunit XdhA [Defluviitaleaceae bacterium]
MKNKVIGDSVPRWDARAKVCGRADYTADIPVKNALHGKIVRAGIAHGRVLCLDIEDALRVPGVVKILTPADLPKTKFATAGHPYSLEPGGDVYDKNILTDYVRLYGDEIAAVIAETPLAAAVAAEKVVARYEELPFYLTTEEAMADGAVELHEGVKNNILADTTASVGDVEQGFAQADHIFESEYQTQIVQHCHMENQAAVAYQDADGRWTCISSTQIPHICRRILGEALEMPWSKFRVIKPFIGGGFGNKQDVIIEPLVVAMSMAVGGRAVRLELEGEEVLAYTRVRHAIRYRSKVGVTKDGRITAWQMDAVSKTGAYASHGHSIAAKGAGILSTLYEIPNMIYRSRTVLTNTGNAGAMRGYGVPQITFAIEAMTEKICSALNMDSFEFRLKNFKKEGAPHPLNGIPMATNKVADCLTQGKAAFGWDGKMAAALGDKGGIIRRGLGVAAFSYATAVYPYSLEIAGCRLTMNQDGTVKMMVGATEIGQGSDTGLIQIAAETLGVPAEMVYAEAVTDTDIAPFDTGCYASRQIYVTGMAVAKAAQELKDKICRAAEQFYKISSQVLDIEDAYIINTTTGDRVASLGDLALYTYYDKARARTLTAEVSNNCHNNSYPMGVTFAEVEVDTQTGVVTLLSMLNAHDSGVIINPLLAEGQVEGGMGMGVGFALGEDLFYDTKTGAPLNNNLLDYKIPTAMDVPELGVLFVQPVDPYGPFGAKGLGEPPLCSPAAAIRNAVCQALGFEIDSLPLTPGKVFAAIAAHRSGGEANV